MARINIVLFVVFCAVTVKASWYSDERSYEDDFNVSSDEKNIQVDDDTALKNYEEIMRSPYERVVSDKNNEELVDSDDQIDQNAEEHKNEGLNAEELNDEDLARYLDDNNEGNDDGVSYDEIMLDNTNQVLDDYEINDDNLANDKDNLNENNDANENHLIPKETLPDNMNQALVDDEINDDNWANGEANLEVNNEENYDRVSPKEIIPDNIDQALTSDELNDDDLASDEDNLNENNDGHENFVHLLFSSNEALTDDKINDDNLTDSKALLEESNKIIPDNLGEALIGDDLNDVDMASDEDNFDDKNEGDDDRVIPEEIIPDSLSQTRPVGYRDDNNLANDEDKTDDNVINLEVDDLVSDETNNNDKIYENSPENVSNKESANEKIDKDLVDGATQDNDNDMDQASDDIITDVQNDENVLNVQINPETYKNSFPNSNDGKEKSEDIVGYEMKTIDNYDADLAEDDTDEDDNIFINDEVKVTQQQKDSIDLEDDTLAIALISENDGIDNVQRKLDNDSEPILDVNITLPPVSETSDKEVKSVDVEDLAPSQYDDLMNQFASIHPDVLDTESEDFGRHVAPIHMSLDTENFVTIESPNYPDPYPTNNVIDWILDGQGSGINFIIDDFYVNGALGDYLLVIPGGVDNSSTAGLLFSYKLNEKREYMFSSEDRLFIRFETQPGMPFRRGFKLRVKMIDTPAVEEEPSEPEPLPTMPIETLSLHLGINLEDFASLEHQFEVLIADMATMYINAEKIDPGLNTTSETVLVVSTSLCNANWPNYLECSKVVFGVPLMYEDDRPYRLSAEDLKKMWDTYSQRDPFALRLERMGIMEFLSPPDTRIMVTWFSLGLAALACTAVLAFALWRYTCHEDYTKMAPTGDSDSIINEKRNLDLYPTPHQTLPSMYYTFDNKWDENDNSTRVDIGGLANNAFVRDDLFDIDSDDENKRDSKAPKDLYNV